MSERATNCPGCGAPLRFAWSSAVQTACPYCHAVVVRTDVDLTKVGELADLPPDASPIQIGTAGVFEDHGFDVVGRIRYEWEQGSWNEWHLAFHDGRSGWLADAQLIYEVSFEAPGEAPQIEAAALEPDQRFRFGDGEYALTTITQAHFAGFEGELPFTTASHKDMTFADLRCEDTRFATLDFSGPKPVLYLGREVEYDTLKLTNVRLFEGWTR
jgi:hypothetical protein